MLWYSYFLRHDKYLMWVLLCQSVHQPIWHFWQLRDVLFWFLNISIVVLCLWSQESTYMCFMFDTFEFVWLRGGCPLAVCVTVVRNDDAGPLVDDGDEKQCSAKDWNNEKRPQKHTVQNLGYKLPVLHHLYKQKVILHNWLSMTNKKHIRPMQSNMFVVVAKTTSLWCFFIMCCDLSLE